MSPRLAVVVTLALGACAAPPPTPKPSVWYRADVSAETTRGVELDCHQRSVEAIGGPGSQADTQSIHAQREQYVERCMRGSGFTRR